MGTRRPDSLRVVIRHGGIQPTLGAPGRPQGHTLLHLTGLIPSTPYGLPWWRLSRGEDRSVLRAAGAQLLPARLLGARPLRWWLLLVPCNCTPVDPTHPSPSQPIPTHPNPSQTHPKHIQTHQTEPFGLRPISPLSDHRLDPVRSYPSRSRRCSCDPTRRCATPSRRCRCDPGWFSVDCSKHVSGLTAPSLQARQRLPSPAAAHSGLRIYVYDMPSTFTTTQLQWRGHSGTGLSRSIDESNRSRHHAGSLYAMELVRIGRCEAAVAKQLL